MFQDPKISMGTLFDIFFRILLDILFSFHNIVYVIFNSLDLQKAQNK